MLFEGLIGCKKVHQFIMLVTAKMVKFHSVFFFNNLFSNASQRAFTRRMLSTYIGTAQDVSHKKKQNSLFTMVTKDTAA
jgi:hypothetical protein